MSKVEIIDDCISGSLEELQRIKREIRQEHTIVYEGEIIPFSIGMFIQEIKYKKKK